MAVNDIIKIRIFCAFDPQESVNVTYWKQTFQTGTGVTLAEIAANIEPTISTLFRGMMGTSARYKAIGVQKVFPLPMTLEVFDGTSAGGGTVMGDMMSPQTAGLTHRFDGLAGRAHRATMYLPFPSETDNDVGGKPTPTAVTGYIPRAVTLVTLFVTPFTVVGGGGSGTFVPVIFHRALGTSDQVTAGQVRSVWAQQKRRSFVRRSDTPTV